MSRNAFRYLVALGVLALAGAASAACGAGPAPVSPLAGDTVAPSASGSVPIGTPSSPAPSDVRASATGGTQIKKDPKPSNTSSACPRAVTLQIDSVADIPKNLCIKSGGVLTVRNLGPDTVGAAPHAGTRCDYEAGATKCTFFLFGDATVNIDVRGDIRSIAVVVEK